MATTKTVTTVNMPPELRTRVDDAAWAARMSRSKFVGQALQDWLDYRENGPLSLPYFGAPMPPSNIIESDVQAPILVVPRGFKAKIV